MCVRQMLLSDMDSLMQLKNTEGWNQVEEDWTLLMNYKNSVSLVALTDNRLAGSITAMNYANKVAWIGMMLVDKKYRGMGISRLLLQEALNKLKHCKSIKLDATPAGKPVYEKFGFMDEYRLIRMTCPSLSEDRLRNHSIESLRISPDDLRKVAVYDKKVFGADRSAMIRNLYERDPELAWMIPDNQYIEGYCLGRKGTRFTQIGPLYAASLEGAKALMHTAMHQTAGKAIVLDVHAANMKWIRWLEEGGFSSLRSFTRMYLKDNPYPGRVEDQYTICGPEFG